MDKFTLFELHVHDGMEFSATNTAPAIGGADDEVAEEEYEELEASVEEGDAESADEDAGRSVGPVSLLVGLVVLAALAFAIRKFRGDDTDLEVAELDDLTEATEGLDEEEAEPEH
ncbi:hypothetical protein [Salinigranum marinum]|uniref:hypothetical protein n=1 Tax=Salinigranum marinum TaxID=1515595 RepID=UPI002989F743|nr:hypothetical protein [Salinigranum marinum]